MSAKMEYTGTDVAEAIKNACEGLNLPQERLNIEITSTGSAGIFGLCRKKAKILVSIKGEAGPAAGAAPEPAPEPAPAAEPPAAPTEAPPKAPPQEVRPAREKKREPAPPAAVGAEMLEQVKGDLGRILELMGYPSEVTVRQEGAKILAHIDGEHVEEIVGSDGQTLDSLQYVLRKMISKRFADKVMLSLDAGDFRETRAKELEETARQLAAEVKESGKTRSIPALNPAERRIVHMVLQEDTTIRSRSVGDGLFKKILIYLPGKGRKRSGKNGKTERKGKR